VDEKKLEALFGTEDFRLASEEEIKQWLGTTKGFVGPFNLPEDIKVLWDNSTYGVKNMVVALNEPDYHYINVNPGRDIQYGEFVDVCEVEEGDPCPKCGGSLRVGRGP
jgi:prolyl-tRNA synthetase